MADSPRAGEQARSSPTSPRELAPSTASLPHTGSASSTAQAAAAVAEAQAGAGGGGPPPRLRSVRLDLTRHGGCDRRLQAAAAAEASAGDGGPPPRLRSARVELTRHGWKEAMAGDHVKLLFVLGKLKQHC